MVLIQGFEKVILRPKRELPLTRHRAGGQGHKFGCTALLGHPVAFSAHFSAFRSISTLSTARLRSFTSG